MIYGKGDLQVGDIMNIITNKNNKNNNNNKKKKKKKKKCNLQPVCQILNFFCRATYSHTLRAFLVLFVSWDGSVSLHLSIN